jgi:hypothetical protein
VLRVLLSIALTLLHLLPQLLPGALYQDQALSQRDRRLAQGVHLGDRRLRSRWPLNPTTGTSAHLTHSLHDSIAHNVSAVPCCCFCRICSQVRYIRVKHLVNETGDWRKVYTWEIGAYGAGGRWGLPPAPQQQSRTFRQLLGVNGIWGWGNKSFSDTLVKQVRENKCTHIAFFDQFLSAVYGYSCTACAGRGRGA